MDVLVICVWWELREEYMNEYPESFEDDPEEEEDESTRD